MILTILTLCSIIFIYNLIIFKFNSKWFTDDESRDRYCLFAGYVGIIVMSLIPMKDLGWI
jgi:hypothetical protein